jgi:hypothetical protein
MTHVCLDLNISSSATSHSRLDVTESSNPLIAIPSHAITLREAKRQQSRSRCRLMPCCQTDLPVAYQRDRMSDFGPAKGKKHDLRCDRWIIPRSLLGNISNLLRKFLGASARGLALDERLIASNHRLYFNSGGNRERFIFWGKRGAERCAAVATLDMSRGVVMTLILWTLCGAGALYLMAWLSFRLLMRKPRAK